MVDSEMLGGQLAANHIDVAHESRQLDHNIVVVNTCGFIDKAKEESINTILAQVELKRRGRLDKVYVTGCLSERYKNNLEQDGTAAPPEATERRLQIRIGGGTVIVYP